MTDTEVTYIVQCPADSKDDIQGCGLIFEATPDDEGLFDCECGMWFTLEESRKFNPEPRLSND